MDPKSALRSENALRCCRARRERKRDQRRLGPSTNLATAVPVPPKDALGEVIGAAMVSGEPMRRGKEQREVPFMIRQQPPTSLHCKRNDEGKFTD